MRLGNASNLTKLAGFGLALALVFGAAWTAGQVAGPTSAADPQGHTTGDHDEPDDGDAAIAPDTLGLASSANGYRLVAGTTHLAVATAQHFPFQIIDADGAAVTDFAVEHDKRMHLIVVRRDGDHFQHVHPEMATNGTWHIPLEFPAAGSYRVFADFRPTGGPATTLSTDIHVAGEYEPVRFNADTRSWTGDGYQVSLTGTASAGAETTFTLTVLRNGNPVLDLEPYLGAYGHLVALRTDDLAYLHVHPHEAPDETATGPAVRFAATMPSGGQYRLFFDFAHDGTVRTADFTVQAFGEGRAAPDDTHRHDHG